MSLFDRLKNNKKPVEQVIEGKSQPQIVAEIHKEFKTATDDLLIEAKKWLEEQADTSQGERLAKLGFTGTSKAKEHIKTEVQKRVNQEIIQQINEARIKFPAYKFITHQMAQDIATRYDLFIGQVSMFKGDVPESNLRDIEKFAGLFKEKFIKIVVKGQYDRKETVMTQEEFDAVTKEIGHKEPLRGCTTYVDITTDGGVKYSQYIEYTHLTPEQQISKMQICATIKDFELSPRHKTQGRFIVEEDPIVLFPFLNGYIVVTAWGAEAAEVINEQHN